MESDWPRRGHPLHEHSAASTTTTHPTLPSVAELIASSKPTSDTFPAYHHRTPSSPLPPIRSATPHSQAVPASAPANAPAPVEQSYFDAARHASRASPTNSATSTTPSEQHYYQQQQPQQQQQQQSRPHLPPSQGVTSENYHHLHDAAHSHTAPINSRRQDSAISHYRLETSKESSSFAPHPEPDFASYSRRSPKDSHRPESPHFMSHLISQSSAPSPSAHPPASSPNLHEHVTLIQNGSASDPSPRSAASPPVSDHISPVTRQQRYNVRFAANYTSANMPPTQRPRPSPPLPAVSAPAEHVEPPPMSRIEPPAPRVEQPASRVERMPIPDARAMILGQGQRRVEPPSHSNTDVPTQPAERCPGCLDVYTAPSPPAWVQQPPAKDAMDYAKATAEFFARKSENDKIAEDDHERWKQKHASCRVKVPSDAGHDFNPLTNTGATNGSSNKRKDDRQHEESARSRRYPFDNSTTSAPPVRPTAPI
ncbi:hypothetical protein HBI56_037200 [Parastagonospora nodorum]|nr:hypothetical protein HBH53_015850 [Parastagonospora nodorum]KAH3986437.1 hypothetical protein HBH52_047010 [Parastagonospora nodorum]KAH4005027.1 hypothetical protein HBI10_040580 [Parastagonospora nodorum]KAH4030722.1 hypothetical protein HBI13_024030 [Parastagonospora nodorum]KAH4040547.1 hypothetical protein HBI09_029360 [Parastagonospora nodorum]